jgi:hypothetical protein
LGTCLVFQEARRPTSFFSFAFFSPSGYTSFFSGNELQSTNSKVPPNVLLEFTSMNKPCFASIGAIDEEPCFCANKEEDGQIINGLLTGELFILEASERLFEGRYGF